MRRAAILVLWALVGCGPEAPAPSPGSDAPAPASDTDEPADAAAAAAAEERNPRRQGYTQRPPPGTPGFPEPIPPLLDEEERAAARTASPGEEEERAAQDELKAFLEAFEESAAEWDEAERLRALERFRDVAHHHARRGAIGYFDVEELHRSYLFPNEVREADARFKGKVVVLEASVAPHNMKDPDDGFKLFERIAYVHEPLLFATDYELAFVECRLAAPTVQKLTDWQWVHVAGVVVGKKRSDVLLERCVVF